MREIKTEERYPGSCFLVKQETVSHSHTQKYTQEEKETFLRLGYASLQINASPHNTHIDTPADKWGKNPFYLQSNLGPCNLSIIREQSNYAYLLFKFRFQHILAY